MKSKTNFYRKLQQRDIMLFFPLLAVNLQRADSHNFTCCTFHAATDQSNTAEGS